MFAQNNWSDIQLRERKNRTYGDHQKEKFSLTHEHQKDVKSSKDFFASMVVLGYPAFCHPFDLETDASLQGMGTVILQREEQDKSHPIAYTSRSLHPSEKSMHNYSPAKLERLALKWEVTEKLRDYVLSSKFSIYTDNSPLLYVKRVS